MDWSNIQKDTFVSSSWDGAVKIVSNLARKDIAFIIYQWTPERARSVMTLHAHHSCVYQALFSPHQADLVLTCSTDGTIKIFDLRAPAYLNTAPDTNTFINPVSAAVLTIPASGTEVLSIDWNKYRPMVLASAGVDKVTRVWDCRMLQKGGVAQVGGTCESQLLGHEYAVRKVQWSPHRADILATASYDMTCRMYVEFCYLFICATATLITIKSSWNTNPPAGQPQLLRIHDPHTEFVVGCGWSLFHEGFLASCGWDGRLHIFRV